MRETLNDLEIQELKRNLKLIAQVRYEGRLRDAEQELVNLAASFQAMKKPIPHWLVTAWGEIKQLRKEG